VIVTSGTGYLAVVPARAGSKRLPEKNLRPLAGKPLLCWTLAHVRACATPMRVAVSTYDARTAELALAEGAEVPALRPAELASDEAPTEPALAHAVATLSGADEIRHVVVLPPTSPVRDAGSIDAAVALYERTGADSLVSVSPASPLQWRGTPEDPVPLYDISARPRLQSVTDDLARFAENGSIVISGAGGLAAGGNRLFGRTVMYVMQAHEAIDVDTAYDLWLAERWMEENRHAR
jgi:CMP-N,N'-diacetyllegionaminic acid synthase